MMHITRSNLMQCTNSKTKTPMKEKEEKRIKTKNHCVRCAFYVVTEYK